MSTILALARKDLRIVTRLRSGLFFTFAWPLIVAIMFGLAFSDIGRRTPTAVRVAIVDEDRSEGSEAFISKLESSGDFVVTSTARADAETMVRRGERAAYVVIKPGFGESSKQLFRGQQQFEIGSDPARQAEGWMIEGLITKHVMADLQPKLPWTPLAISRAAVVREQMGPASGFEITFPQGIMWGILGCAMSFAVGLVRERVRGTYVRLQSAPITRTQILAGKALACFTTITLLQVTLVAIGVLGFGVTPSSYALLALACVTASLGFVGFMMLVAGLARTEEAAGGAGWAFLMPMTLFGGGMMPQAVMPAWMQTVGSVSPVKWAIRGIEGAVWRDFTLTEMLLPCGILLAFGLVCFVIGVRASSD
jgi:ABC-2 type transport system permease protein